MGQHSILFVNTRLDGRSRWKSILNEPDFDVVYATQLDLSVRGLVLNDIHLVLVEGSGVADADIELCTRLRDRVQAPLLLLSENATEEFILAAYAAGIDEFVPGRYSPALVKAKLRAWFRWRQRQPQLVFHYQFDPSKINHMRE
ncbi:MAG: response regulator transcription factor [Caldilineaceae bacterium]|nr:response regulator transcription factor [Caldilineaceae bacterium]